MQLDAAANPSVTRHDAVFNAELAQCPKRSD